MTDRSFLGNRLATLDDAKAWIKALVEAEMDFHLEDSPYDIIVGPSGQRLFTNEEAEVVRKQVKYLYSFDWAHHECPIGYMLQCMEERDSLVEFVVRHRWKADLSVVSHTVVRAETLEAAKAEADRLHPEHLNEVVERKQ